MWKAAEFPLHAEKWTSNQIKMFLLIVTEFFDLILIEIIRFTSIRVWQDNSIGWWRAEQIEEKTSEQWHNTICS